MVFILLKQGNADEIPAKKSLQPDFSKDDIAAYISHEIRTPLTGILGVIHLLETTELDRSQRRYVDTAANSSQMLLANINDVISYARTGSDNYVLEAEKFDLAEVVEDVASILAPAAISKGLDLICDIDPKIPYPITGDELRLRQLLHSLLNNAIKNTEFGHVVVYVANDNTGLNIGVKDTGPGLAEEQQMRLLEPSTKTDIDSSRPATCAGLGLTSSCSLIAAMGSKLQIESTLGEGSQFYFKIDIDPGQRSIFDWKPPQALQQLSIGIVSPLAIQRRSIRKLLQYWKIADVREIDLAVKQGADLPAIEPCDLLIIDQTDSEQAVNDMIERLRNQHDWRSSRFVHLIYQNRPSIGGSADVRLYKPISRSRLYAAMMEIVYKLAFNAEYESLQAGGEHEAHGVLHGRRILLAEDNEINKMIVLEMLHETGVEVDVVINGADAVAQVQHKTYDLILMDIQMPVMDGYEATQRIRALGGNLDIIPIIAMTAHALEGDSVKSLAAGLDYHVSKPFEPDELIAIILRFIEQQNQESLA